MHLYFSWLKRTVVFAVLCAGLVLGGVVLYPHSGSGQLLYPGYSPSGEVAGTTTAKRIRKFVLTMNAARKNKAVQATVLAQATNQTLASNATSSSATTGEFGVNMPDGTDGNVNVRIKVDGYLSRVISNIDPSTAASGTPVEVPELVAGDLTGDNVIDNSDVSAIRNDWFVGPEVGDYNGDGVVNTFDLAIVKSNYLKTGE